MIFRVLALVLVFTTACGPAPLPPLPFRTAAHPAPMTTLVWVGTAAANRWENGAWQRIPSFDYEFTVVQRRYADHWDSVKSLHRRHPKYDNSAGPRDQSYHFRVDLAPRTDGVDLAVRSTLGDGRGQIDAEFRRSVLELRASQSGRFVPFDRFVLTQHYRYEDGRLDETVELRKGAVPWVRNDEAAVLFAEHRFARPATTIGAATN